MAHILRLEIKCAKAGFAREAVPNLSHLTRGRSSGSAFPILYKQTLKGVLQARNLSVVHYLCVLLNFLF